VPYTCTILRAKPGKRLAKRYSDPAQRPDDYDAGVEFRAREQTFATFREFVTALGQLRPDECLIRGAIKADARPDIAAGTYVRRLEYDKDASDPLGACVAAFEPADRNWIVLDLDDSDSPFDPSDVAESIEFWRESLPPDLQGAEAAFFMSASAHRSETLRGKLVVALGEPLSNSEAEAWAKAHGFDGSVCRTVQPNYFAAPVFDGCRDPLAGKRTPWLLPGKSARLTPAKAMPKPTAAPSMACIDVPAGALEPTERVFALAESIADRWIAGNRIAGNGWLHLAGWLLGKGWRKSELAALLDLLDIGEDPRKAAEHRHILGNAKPIDGLGGAREWLGGDVDDIDVLVNYDSVSAAYGARVAERLRASHYRGAANDTGIDPWDDDTDFTGDDEPLEYACEGLRLAPSRGKISVIAGNAGGGKGPIANHLAVCFALGLKAFGVHECVQSKVLLVDYEGRRLTKRRLRRMARALGRDPAELQNRVYHVDASATGSALDGANIGAIARRVEQDEIEVVILDSYTTAMLGSGIDSNSPQYAELAQALGRLGVTVIAVAHAAKAHARDGVPHLSDIAGSGALGALAQTAIMVHYPAEADPFRVSITCARAPETPFAPFEIRFADVEHDGLAVTLAEPTAAAIEGGPTASIEKMRERLAATTAHADRIEQVLAEVDTLGAGLGPKKIKDAVGLTSKQYAAAVAECSKRGTITLAALPSDREVKLRLAGVKPYEPEARLPVPGSLARRAKAHAAKAGAGHAQTARAPP
jgi:hypothetical protein